ncbi:Sister chromatid cohesion protein DCC1 [Apodemus speciosus]|uniref:Sister chromatid cohesion protein DCC1 n=1 Tax=Apodemus speciosus TaxID=105296 RepID=A0ABQ0FJE1_APOSI
MDKLVVVVRTVGLCEDEVYFELNADKICRATAEMLLQNAVKFNLAEFQEVWQQSVPEGMTTRLDQLKGLALVDRNSRPEIIFLLKVDDLPEGTQERFNSLFSLREKWMEEDIAPYIQWRRFVRREANYRCAADQILSVFNAKWRQSL